MKIIFAGTPSSAADALEDLAAQHEIKLVITRPDAESGRKRILTPSAVAKRAAELGLPVLKAAKIGDQELDVIRQSGAELGIVIAYGTLLPKPALELMPWWNVHFSLLPHWRGATPLQQSILHAGVGAGVSLFKLDRGLDTGDILAQQPISLNRNETTAEALPRFSKIGTELVLKCIIEMPVGKPQQGTATYAPKLTRSDARLSPSYSADENHRMICAYNPEPVAWFENEGLAFRVLKSNSLGGTRWAGEILRPGLVSIENNRVVVECGFGTQLELLEVQPFGKNPMGAGDWFRGLNRQVVLE